MGLAIFFWFFVFSRFFWFLTKSIKNFEENQKKNKIADPNSPACACMGLAILVLFAFLHDVRPCARWWLQFMKECSNCVVKITVLAHCHGRPFWIVELCMFKIHYIYICSFSNPLAKASQDDQRQLFFIEIAKTRGTWLKCKLGGLT